MALTKKTKAVSKSPYVYTCPWGEFTHDAPVKLLSARFKGRNGLSFVFRNHVLNPESNKEWVEVYGGGMKIPTGIHAVPVDEIELIKPKRKYTKRKK